MIFSFFAVIIGLAKKLESYYTAGHIWEAATNS